MKKRFASGKGVSYAKWGYIFILPFFVAYIFFTLIPQVMTIYNSFFENYRDGLTQVGPRFVGLQNYIKLFTPDSAAQILWQYGDSLGSRRCTANSDRASTGGIFHQLQTEPERPAVL